MPLESFIARAMARLRARQLLRAVTAGAFAAALMMAAMRLAGSASAILPSSIVALVVFIAMVALTRRAADASAAAAAVERAEPSLRNVLITAQQLLVRPEGTRGYMRDRVIADAARRAADVDVRRAIPLARDAAVLGAAVAAFALASVVRPAAALTSSAGGSKNSGSTTALQRASFAVDVVPPSYSGRPAVRFADPGRIEVLAGSRGTLRLINAAGAEVRMNDARLPVAPDGSVALQFADSGFIAIAGSHLNRLVPLTVVADRVPEVRIAAPAKDLRVPSATTSIPIDARASDDLGLRLFELRYTVVSGTGEQFTFTEGTLPASVTESSDGRWTLTSTLALSRLKLEPGDALIYRAVAADRRPGDAGLASSDTYFVEVAGPGDVPLEGVEMPPDKERYALSQAMIVLKIERLQASERTLSREAVIEAAGNIAAEQRAVRANFIFLLGGEVEDEEAEAESSHEISEGRLVNQARREIVNATLLMSRAEKALSAPSTREALPPAREAVKALQRAFGHSRYLLRALPSRARIDPARRGSGDVSSALDWTRALIPPAPDLQTEAARAALSDLVTANAMLDDRSRRTTAVTILSGAAERLLSAGRDDDLSAAARDIIAARDAVTAGKAEDAITAVRRAAEPLVRYAQRGRIDGTSIGRAAARLAGAAAAADGGGKR